MEGDLAPLPEMLPILQKYGVRIMVDDAHGMGVMGDGHGTAWHFGLTDQVDLIMSTFSKAFRLIGRICRRKCGCDLIHQAPCRDPSSFLPVFHQPMLPRHWRHCTCFRKNLNYQPEYYETLNRMRTGFRSLGFNIGNSVTPVVPIIIGDDQLTFMMWKALFEAGVFVNPVIAPATPPGRQLLRTSYMATHTNAQLDQVLDTFATIGKKLGVI